MTWNSVMGLVSSIALLFPIVLIVIFRLGIFRSFPALLIYYTTIFLYNLAKTQYIPVGVETLGIWNIVNNFFDGPLMLIFLTYFSPTQKFTNKMKAMIIGLIVFQIAVISIVGFNHQAVSIFLAPAILAVFGLCLHFFVRQTKITITHQKAAGKAIISAALLFAYGCYTIIYLLYYVFKTPYVDDTFLVYFLVVTLSSLLMGVGIIAERKRVQKLNELLQTRRELSALYSDETQRVTILRPLGLDFDKDPWV